MLCVMGWACGALGCGPNVKDYVGTYEGKNTRDDKQGEVIYSYAEEPYFVYVAPGEEGELVIQLRDECAVAATMGDDGALTISGQPCTQGEGGADLNAVVDGSGMLDEEAGSLTLSFTVSGKRQINMKQVDYRSTNSFEGERQ